MTALLVFGIGILILSLLAVLVVFNFIRYRFDNDATPLFVGLFVGLCLICVSATILMLRTGAASATVTNVYK